MVKKNELKKRIRLVVFRSRKYIEAQIVDDDKQSTLVSVTRKDLDPKTKITKSEQAAKLGEILAAKALKKGLGQIRFDRHGYRYHGRIKALADGDRKGSLNF
jgi:large subunit ribosomal protein L18